MAGGREPGRRKVVVRRVFRSRNAADDTILYAIGDGADAVDGGAGSDTLIGDLGTDMLNGGSDVDTADYSWLTQQIVAIADRHGEGRVISTLEGGYSLTALAEAGAAHVRALFGLAD